MVGGDTQEQSKFSIPPVQQSKSTTINAITLNLKMKHFIDRRFSRQPQGFNILSKAKAASLGERSLRQPLDPTIPFVQGQVS